jgi:hypothetical protein
MAKAMIPPAVDEEEQEPIADDEGAEPAPEGEEATGGEQPTGKGGLSPNAPPEQQQQYERFVLNGMLIIYDKKANATIIQQLRSGAKVDPVGTLAQVAVMVVSRLREGGGVNVGPDVMMQGGAEIIEELAELSDRAGAHTYTDEEKQAALYKGADLMQAQMKQKGEITPDQAKKNLDQLKSADQEGELDKIPGLKDLAGKANAKGKPEGKEKPPQGNSRRGMMVEA